MQSSVAGSEGSLTTYGEEHTTSDLEDKQLGFVVWWLMNVAVSGKIVIYYMHALMWPNGKIILTLYCSTTSCT